MDWTGIEARDGTTYSVGDLVRLVSRPGDEVFEGFINVINEDYIVLTATGHEPVPGFGATLGFPWANVKTMTLVSMRSEPPARG